MPDALFLQRFVPNPFGSWLEGRAALECQGEIVRFGVAIDEQCGCDEFLRVCGELSPIHPRSASCQMPMRIMEIEWIGRRLVFHNEAHRIGDPALFFACEVVVEVSRSLTRKLPQNSVETITAANCLVDRGLKSTLTDRKSTRLNSSHLVISYAVFCLKKKK